MKAYYRLILSENGRVIKRTRWRRSRSFVLNFMGLLFVQAAQTSFSMTDISGTSRGISAYTANLAMNGGAGNTNMGIVVGSGTAAPTPNDYKLATLITHGTAAGQLSYGACAVGSPTASGSDVLMTLTRALTNGSGADVTVTEIGVHAEGNISSTVYYFLVLRDVLPSPVTVANGQTLTVQYTFKTTV